jgi:hypothetical protein
MKEVLDKFGSMLEPYRVDFETAGKLSLNRKVRWVVLLESQAVIREKEMSACHRSLLDAMQTMRSWILSKQSTVTTVVVSTEVTVSGASSPPPTYAQAVDPIYLEMRRKQHMRRSPSIAKTSNIGEAEIRKLERSRMFAASTAETD